ncbi:hypothetical protein ACQJBY_001198 [Aegilops geniculata]
MRETLRENSEEPAMKEVIEDPDGEGLNRFFAQACYSCGEEGHFSEYCTKESQEYLGDFLIVEVKFDPQEIEALIITKKSRKRKRRHPQNNPISAEKDLSHITCYMCKDLGHYADRCPEKKPRTKRADIIPKKPKDLSEFICFRCKEAVHYATKFPNKMKAGAE